MESSDLQRGGVPGAERILAAWYADQPLLPEDQKEGRPPKDKRRSVDNVNTSKGGNDNTYTLRRLARDAPEILSKVQSGELTVNQAATTIERSPVIDDSCRPVDSRPFSAGVHTPDCQPVSRNSMVFL